MAKIQSGKKVKSKPTVHLENKLREKGYVVAGVDEAGMSPLAGPVVASAVILDPAKPIKGLNDSKKLTPEQREDLYDKIMDRALDWGIGFGSVESIAEKNIYWASRDAMIAAIRQLNPAPNFLLIDGNQILHVNILQNSIVKGDGKCSCIAAASILAKVTRDRLMEKLHEQYPDYGWAQNKGYPTPFHRQMIKEHGITPLHRRGFAGVDKEGAWTQ
jgi:ribonuclease HII